MSAMTELGLFVPGEGAEFEDWRDAPLSDPQRLDAIREAFPTEAEYDVVLTRKMQRRDSGPYSGISLETMSASLHRYLKDQLGEPFEVRDVRWLSGGASKLQVAFDLHQPGSAGPKRLCIRMDPAESLNTTSRRREFQMIQALAGRIPVPEVFGLDADGRWFPEPALIYAFVDGTTKSARTTARPSGAGMVFPEDLRAPLGEQFVDHLAAIHTTEVDAAALDAFSVPKPGSTDSALWQLNRARRVWEEDRGEDWPLVELAALWLEENLPTLDEVSPLHGDYRSGNFLFDESAARITAWLDWERTYLGDRHRDLAWTTGTVFGNYENPDRTFLVCGLLSEAEFFERYEKASGLTVHADSLHFYRMLNAYQLVVSNLATAHRVVKLGKTHQDVLLAWLEGVVYPFAKQLVVAMEEGAR